MLARRVVRALLPRGVRTLFSTPLPTAKFADAPTANLGLEAAAPGSPLTLAERTRLGAARRDGFVVFANGCGASLANRYLEYCIAAGRPYIAVSRCGGEVVVDVNAARGPAGARAEAKADAVLSALSAVLEAERAKGAKARWTLQLSSPSAPNDLTAVREKRLEGTNTGKSLVRDVDSVFVAHVAKRAEALALAQELVLASCKALGQPLPAEAAEARRALAAARRERHEARVKRRLDRMLEDDRQRVLLPRAQVEGYLRAQARE